MRVVRLLGRKDTRTVTQLLTGHGVSNHCIQRLNRSDTFDCRNCMEEEDTSVRVLGQCSVCTGTEVSDAGLYFLGAQADRAAAGQGFVLLLKEHGTGLAGDCAEAERTQWTSVWMP